MIKAEIIKPKVFISQPMGGISDSLICDKRNAITKFLNDNGYDVIDSYIRDDNKSRIEMLGMSIELLAQADYIYMSSGWELAFGCRIEHDIAEANKIEVITNLEYFIDRRIKDSE